MKLFSRYCCLFPVVEVQGLKTAPKSKDEFKNEWGYKSTTSCALMKFTWTN